MTALSKPVDVIAETTRAAALLQPARLALLEALGEPASAAQLARRLDLPRQRVNYHLRELETHGLIVLREERTRGNVTERVYERTGSAYAISTDALGGLGAHPLADQDAFSAAFQIGLASRAVRDLGVLERGARAASKTLPTYALDVLVRFATAAARNAFAAELSQAVADLIAKYHDDAAPRGREFRFYVGAYPRVKP